MESTKGRNWRTSTPFAWNRGLDEATAGVRATGNQTWKVEGKRGGRSGGKGVDDRGGGEDGAGQRPGVGLGNAVFRDADLV